MAPDTLVINVATVVATGCLVSVCEHRVGIADLLIGPESLVVGYVAQQPVMAVPVTIAYT